MQDKGQGRVDEFLELFTAHQPRLQSYVFTLVPRWADAEEIMQRCSIVLWKKFDHFETGSHFFAWACQVARLEVKTFRRQSAREHLVFSDEFVDAVAAEEGAMAGELTERLRALQWCVEKLPAASREMLRLRYHEGGSVERVAAEVSRSVEAVYKSLNRTRQALLECITRRLSATGGA